MSDISDSTNPSDVASNDASLESWSEASSHAMPHLFDTSSSSSSSSEAENARGGGGDDGANGGFDSVSEHETFEKELNARVEAIMNKPKSSASNWSLLRRLRQRELELGQCAVSTLSNPLHSAQRLCIDARLSNHSGCVNCVSFCRVSYANSYSHSPPPLPLGGCGPELLASGSDDLHVTVWDWQRRRTCCSYRTGHVSNVFDARFLSAAGDSGYLRLVTTSRDGQIRSAVIGSDGSCLSERRLAKHDGSGRKLALPADPSFQTVLSCGEDGAVISIDIRDSRPNVIIVSRSGAENHSARGRRGRIVAANCIAAHPSDSNVLALACVDRYVRLYDRRMLGPARAQHRALCPQTQISSDKSVSVTSCAFNHDGSELVASYNDEDIYLFNVKSTDSSPVLHSYSGHRNNATIKGVNFYGAASELIVSGSDCGNIFFWHKESERIVQCVRGDDNGVVNCLEPHPYYPVMATSGLDSDVKLWLPTADTLPTLEHVEEIVASNISERLQDGCGSDLVGGNLMWSLMRQVLRSERRRQRARRFDLNTSHSDGDSDGDSLGPPDCRPV